MLLTKTSTFIIGPVATLLGYIMNAIFWVQSQIGIESIGLCIILFTIVIYMLLLPLTIKQQKFSRLQSKMNPELQAIQKKYKGKNQDQAAMMKMNEETQAVYQKYGVNPMGSCLQMVIQMPILFALYRVIYCIPAYVMPVKEHFLNVVYALTGASSASALSEGAAANLLQFATDHNIALTGINPVGDLTGVTGEALANKMVDILYKLNPAQWSDLAQAFPNAADVISGNAATIEKMNTFLGINLASNPFNGSFVPNLAWLIPILAGLTQYASTKLMMATQPKKNNEEDMSSQMMQSMNVTMPLMSVFFCFTFPAAIGIYWVASSTFQLLQQLVVNSYLNKVDMDELIRKNVEKANKKRAKKGLPPQKVNQNATASLKHMQAVQEREEAERAEKLEKSKKQVEASNSYYNKDAKPGSLASKANMVARYNEKHNNK